MSDDWESLLIQAPAEDTATILLLLREKFGFTTSTLDHCELTRGDGARVSYGPMGAPTQPAAAPTQPAAARTYPVDAPTYPVEGIMGLVGDDWTPTADIRHRAAAVLAFRNDGIVRDILTYLEGGGRIQKRRVGRALQWRVTPPA